MAVYASAGHASQSAPLRCPSTGSLPGRGSLPVVLVLARCLSHGAYGAAGVACMYFLRTRTGPGSSTRKYTGTCRYIFVSSRSITIRLQCSKRPIANIDKMKLHWHDEIWLGIAISHHASAISCQFQEILQSVSQCARCWPAVGLPCLAVPLPCRIQMDLWLKGTWQYISMDFLRVQQRLARVQNGAYLGTGRNPLLRNSVCSGKAGCFLSSNLLISSH